MFDGNYIYLAMNTFHGGEYKLKKSGLFIQELPILNNVTTFNKLYEEALQNDGNSYDNIVYNVNYADKDVLNYLQGNI